MCGPGLLDVVLEQFAGPEFDRFRGGNSDAFSGAGIAPRTGFATFHHKRAEAGERQFALGGQTFGNGIQKGVQRTLGSGLGQIALNGDAVYQISLSHQHSSTKDVADTVSEFPYSVVSAQNSKNEEISYFAFLKIFSDKINSRELLLKVCSCLTRAYADIIAYSVKNSDDMNFFTLDEMNRISCSIGVDSAIKCSEAVMKTALLQQSNVNISLSLTALASMLWNNV